MSSTIATAGRPAEHRDQCRIRIAAAGDIHYGERADDRERAAAAFGALEGRVDVILLAGDLTTHGEPEQAQIVADVVRDLDVEAGGPDPSGGGSGGEAGAARVEIHGAYRFVPLIEG